MPRPGRHTYIPMDSLSNETVHEETKTSNAGLTPCVPPNRPECNGVSPDSVHTSSPNEDTGSEKSKWFLMRAAYGQEKKAAVRLQADGVEVFLPEVIRLRKADGREVRKVESLIPNFLFVKSTEATLRNYTGAPGLEFFHHYYVPHKDKKGIPIGFKGTRPLVIPDDQMDMFRKWHSVDDDHKLFLKENALCFNEGQQVRITDGKFAGITGYVCRVKKQSRIGVAIEGLGIIVTAYIPKAFLKKIE